MDTGPSSLESANQRREAFALRGLSACFSNSVQVIENQQLKKLACYKTIGILPMVASTGRHPRQSPSLPANIQKIITPSKSVLFSNCTFSVEGPSREQRAPGCAQGPLVAYLALEGGSASVVQVLCGVCVKMIHAFVFLEKFFIFTLKYRTRRHN